MCLLASMIGCCLPCWAICLTGAAGSSSSPGTRSSSRPSSAPGERPQSAPWRPSSPPKQGAAYSVISQVGRNYVPDPAREAKVMRCNLCMLFVDCLPAHASLVTFGGGNPLRHESWYGVLSLFATLLLWPYNITNTHGCCSNMI